MDIRIKYDPVLWASRMHTGTWTNACLVGGLGSGKTTAALRELQACALENPGFTYLIGRKTLPSLRDTTMKTFFDVVEDGFIKSHNKSQNIVTLVNNSEFIFRPLDDMEKFKSLEIAGFFIDEANEVEEDLYMTLKSRVRQQVKEAPPTRYRTIISLNPGEETHWIPQLFLHRKPKGSEIFFSTTMDNMKNLPPNYVDDLMSMYSKDMQQRMLYGQFGRVHKGRPVFPQFQRGNFIRAIEPIAKEVIYRCFDFGFQNPACVWVQFIDGQLRVLAEKLGKRIYLDDFLHECFAYEAGLWGQWPKEWYKAFCDPRGSDESDKGKSSVQILNEHGIYPVHRRTFIEEGIKAIKGLLDGVNGGEPNFLIHDRCGILVEAFRGGYARADGENEPEKDGYYDHLMDALRYGAIHLTRRHQFQHARHVIDQQNVYIHPITGRRQEF